MPPFSYELGSNMLRFFIAINKARTDFPILTSLVQEGQQSKVHFLLESIRETVNLNDKLRFY